jgi:hypothetical protein
VTAPLARFGLVLAVLSIVALGGCGTSTGSQASPTASDSLAGTGLTACPSLADVATLSDSSPAELRKAISQGASGAVSLDATADGLTASVILTRRPSTQQSSARQPRPTTPASTPLPAARL